MASPSLLALEWLVVLIWQWLSVGAFPWQVLGLVANANVLVGCVVCVAPLSSWGNDGKTKTALEDGDCFGCARHDLSSLVAVAHIK